ncbi:uncharacterized protein HaLaN_11525 [Haematococcus lacustris]|uniref:Uncharacterized protein n=1 Tax=Haematococcus lacustris TaxID=44745 RepID=A0A699Z006_HAELA|nr:uncharacterized protein HaLaN_11525 [Haematococcus lacustris]
MAQNTLVYDRWFAFADTDRDGRVTGKDAVSFFEKSGLPRDVLAKVWDMANSGRQGYLDRMSFHKAMDLISLAQQEGLPEAPMLMQQYPATTSFGGAGPSFMSPTVYSPETTPRWGKKGEQKRPVPAKVCTSIVDGLKQVYNSKVKPLEEAFGNFFSPLLNDSDFEAKPSVLLLGQYSTGKTTFIKYLLGRDYPGSHIGPEPTTDRFVVVYHGLEERRVPGNTLAVQPDKPYQGLASFGTGFLSRFEGSQCPARLLEEITLVDTPGVLSGEKQRIERSYNFVEIARWFAARCDLIFLLFDPYKLDISDEFKQVLPDQARPRLGCTAGVCPFRVRAGLGAERVSGLSSAPHFDSLSPSLLSCVSCRAKQPMALNHVRLPYVPTASVAPPSTACAVLLPSVPELAPPPCPAPCSAQVITAMRGHDDKVRVILNKADQVDQQQLMRVYGALMWSLGKVFRSPEVCRVYVGSFNSDAPISEAKNPYGRTLFEAEQKELLASLYDIPQALRSALPCTMQACALT